MGDVECEARPSNARKVVILGGGPNRIGQGIEFDYCCCHACFALTAAGYETIMINCNPETVSTDYDTSDRLYFEPLTLEHVLEILRVERENGTLQGVIVQFGGQTPLKLAQALAQEGIPILGTTPDAIDLAEDRDRERDAQADQQPRPDIAPERVGTQPAESVSGPRERVGEVLLRVRPRRQQRREDRAQGEQHKGTTCADDDRALHALAPTRTLGSSNAYAASAATLDAATNVASTSVPAMTIG
jgi:hypothetical protein